MMKIQSSKFKVQEFKFKIQNIEQKVQNLKFKIQSSRLGLLCCTVMLLLVFALSSVCTAEANKESKWPGVDESVVEKYAKEHGREAREPLINTDQGDLLLFVFLLAGTAGGFAAGYYWRVLLEQRTREKDNASTL
ncbi:MAG: hypothetical protein LLF86_00020 [Nitrospiraceae bacterium]|nr:hypothetical protein [Nitrospiraceae bacterium]